MNLNQINYLPFVIVAAVVLVVVFFFYEKKFFAFIKTYWFFKRSKINILSSFLVLLGFIGLAISLLDFRGPEEKVKTAAPAERTIILIDTSASMLAEDVKPSRLQKAVLIAKHFARKAGGHQLSIVAFAEIQRKIVPFTNDLDLIDARLDSLKNLKNQYGSSALNVALQESVQYFKESGGEPVGNILVLTDGEETAESIDLKIPESVHVALVGIGTTQGGRIPLDDSRGFRYGYKKDKGVDVITKLNESYFKDVVKQIPSGKYWMANTYSLPSEEILEFFTRSDKKSEAEQDMVIKPVLMEYVVIPSLILLVAGYVLKFFKVFATLILILYLPLGFSQDNEKKIELSPEVQDAMESLKRGELNKVERLKLASDLLKSGAAEEANSLFKENLNSKDIEKDLPPEAYLNFGNSFLETGDVNEALNIYDRLDSSLDNSARSQEIRDTMDKNIASFFKQQEEKNKEDQKQKKKDKDQNKGNDENKSNDKNSGNSDQNQDKNQQQGNDSKSDEKKDQDQNGENENKENNAENNEQNENKKEMSGEEEQKKTPPQKLPAKLKQLMFDDRQLQMRMIENGTKDLNKRKSRKSKDW